MIFFVGVGFVSLVTNGSVIEGACNYVARLRSSAATHANPETGTRSIFEMHMVWAAERIRGNDEKIPSELSAGQEFADQVGIHASPSLSACLRRASLFRRGRQAAAARVTMTVPKSAVRPCLHRIVARKELK